MNRNWNLKPMPQSRFEEMVDLSRILNAIFVASLLAIGMITINVIRGAVNFATLSVAGLFFFTAGLFWIYKQGYFLLTGAGMIASISVVVTINLVAAGGIHDNAVIVFPLLITVGGLVLGKRFIPYLTGLFLAETSVIYWLTVTGRINPFGGAVEIQLQSYLTVVSLLLISGVVIWITVSTLENNFRKIINSEIRLRESYDQTISGWGRALELFDRDIEGHSLRVIDLTLALAQEVGLEGADLEHIRRGALLHDVGKLGVNEEILNKPESLTGEERRQVETHPLNAHKLLKDIPFLEKAIDIPVYHHERWDGSGYPFRLAGEEIPLAARIFAIVDNWDALRSDRPYRKAWPREQVIQYLRVQAGEKFDPDLVETFIALVE